MDENPYQPPTGVPPAANGAWLNRWLILLVIVAAVDAFLLIALPGLGVAALVLTAVPATRVYVTASRAPNRGIQLHFLEGLHLAFMTAMVVIGSLAAGAIAFGCVCNVVGFGGVALGLNTLLGRNGDNHVYLALGLSGLAALATVAVVAIKLWPAWPKPNPRLVDERGPREERLGPADGPK